MTFRRRTPVRLRLCRSSLLAIGLIVLAAVGCGGDSDGAAPVDATADTERSSAPTTAPDTTTTTAAPTTTSTTAAPTTTTEAQVDIAINHMQVLGSHNSYHLKPDPAIFDALVALAADLAASIEYSHRSLTEQLEDFGIRQFEIDVHADPAGGLFLDRAADALVGLEGTADPALAEAGFKVLHTPDVDYATTCLTLVACLEEIDAWSEANPNHLPIMIMLEFKSDSVPDVAADEGLDLTIELPWTVPLPPSPDLLVDLDAEIRSVFEPDRLIEPDDVRNGAISLESAVLENGWPTIAESRGKVLFTMTDGGSIRDMYVADSPNLEGRPIFTNAPAGQPDAAFMRFDDPADPALDVAVAAGYLVRTRTDVPTADSRAGDTARRDEALAGGAHFLSTDYYTPSELFESSYSVELPGRVIARCNRVAAPDSCTTADLAE